MLQNWPAMGNGAKRKNTPKNNMFYKFEKVPHSIWGPWRNQWGYITTVAQFDQDDIILKTITPYNTKIVKRFSDWEDCQYEIELIEADRRF